MVARMPGHFEEQQGRVVGLAAALAAISDEPDEALCGRLLCQMSCNNFSITDDLLQPVASGCFPVGALLDHSCDPNCVLMYEGTTQIVRAIRDIAPEEELTHSFIDLAAPTAVRRSKLQTQYFFTCRCALCGDAARTAERDAMLGDGTLHDVHVQAAELEARGDLEAACRALDSLLPRLEATLPPHTLTLLASRCLRHRIAIELGDHATAARLCAAIVETYKAIYPPNHPLTGLQLFTLASLWATLDVSQAEIEPVLAEARRILTITHGASSSMVESLSQV